jgi:hypothetical protein
MPKVSTKVNDTSGTLVRTPENQCCSVPAGGDGHLLIVKPYLSPLDTFISRSPSYDIDESLVDLGSPATSDMVHL